MVTSRIAHSLTRIAVVAVVIAAGALLLARHLHSPDGREHRHQVIAFWSRITEPPRETADHVTLRHRVANPLGVNTFLEREVDPANRRRQLEMARDAGFHFIRQQFSWHELEEAGKGVYVDPKFGRSTWAKFDEIVSLTEELGLELIVRLDTSPEWARVGNLHPQTPPDNLVDYGDYVEAVVSRYRGRVRYYQIWNEPNLAVDWGNRPLEQPIDPAAATRLLREGFTRAKRADPAALILAPALSPTIEESPAAMNELKFLQAMYDAGARDYFDIGSVQAYGLYGGPDDRRLGPRDVTFSRPILVREVMVRNGDAEKPIWVSEMGWNVPPAGAQPPFTFGEVTPEQQARYTVRALQRAREEWPWLGVMNIWYLKPTDNRESQELIAGFRLLDVDFTPRPVYTEIKEYTRGLGIK
jgi:polysaccharide biosynthesis protein PslG